MKNPLYRHLISVFLIALFNISRRISPYSVIGKKFDDANVYNYYSVSRLFMEIVMGVKIGALAKMIGCPVVTIRFYEKKGLLKAPERTESNYRLYGDKDIERLRFIKHCRRHDMTLSEIRELLAFKDNPKANCDWVGTLIQKHITNVEEQIESLIQLKDQLEHLQHKCSGGKKEGCGIIKSLSDSGGCSFCEDFRCRSERKQNNMKFEEKA